MRVKKIIFSILFVFIQIIDCQAISNIYEKADSLFNAKNYTEAAKLYEGQLKTNKANQANISLKLAYIFEQNNDISKQLYYLNYHYNLNPSDVLFDKMNEIALENKFRGFERSDLNFILLLYQQYYYYLIYLFVGIGILLLYLLVRKKSKGEFIVLRHKILIGLYLIILVLMVNLPSSYKSAIVNQDSYFRKFPSAGSMPQGKIGKGNKLNIFGEDDAWLRVYWDGEIVFVKKNTTWALPS